MSKIKLLVQNVQYYTVEVEYDPNKDVESWQDLIDEQYPDLEFDPVSGNEDYFEFVEIHKPEFNEVQ